MACRRRPLPAAWARTLARALVAAIVLQSPGILSYGVLAGIFVEVPAPSVQVGSPGVGAAVVAPGLGQTDGLSVVGPTGTSLGSALELDGAPRGTDVAAGETSPGTEAGGSVPGIEPEADLAQEPAPEIPSKSAETLLAGDRWVAAENLSRGVAEIRTHPSETPGVLGRFFDKIRSWGTAAAFGETVSGSVSAGVGTAHTPTGLSQRAEAGEGGGANVPVPTRPPEPGRPSRSWAWKAAGLAAAFLALDWGLKFLFVAAGFPFVYHGLGLLRLLFMKFAVPVNLLAAGYYLWLAHADKPPLESLKRFRENHPVIGGVLYAMLQILTFPVGLGEKRHAGDLPAKYPAARTMQKILLWSAAALAAAGLGNGLEAIFNGRVVDFIPFGHGRMNLADAYIFFGLPLLWMGLDFFKDVRKSEEEGKPITFKAWRYNILPMLGLLVFAYSTWWGYDKIPLPAWYVEIFSVLFSAGVFAASIVVSKIVEAYNKRFTPGPPSEQTWTEWAKEKSRAAGQRLYGFLSWD